MAIAYVTGSSGTATDGTVDIARLGSAGQILIAQVVATNTAAIGAFTWGSGWNVLDSQETDNVVMTVRSEIAWFLRTSGDPTSWAIDTGSSTTSGQVAHYVYYSGCDTTAPVVVDEFGAQNTGTTATTTSPSTPTATSSVSGLWAVALFSQAGFVATRTWSSYTGSLTERIDAAEAAGNERASGAIADTNGTVDASGGVSYTATPSGTGFAHRAAVLLLQPPTSSGTSASGGTTTQTGTSNAPVGRVGAKSTEYYRTA